MSWQIIDGICYLVDERNGKLFTLNEIAYVVWSGILNGNNIKNIVSNVAETYQADIQMVENDIGQLVQGFKEQGFITEVEE